MCPRYGYFSGINRKIQIKYLGKPRDGTDSENANESRQDSGSDERSAKKKQGKESKETKKNQAESKDEHEVQKKDSGDGKPPTVKDGEAASVDQKGHDEKQKVPADQEHSLLLILKWGGELTTMGKEQALQLGRAFRYRLIIYEYQS